MLLTKPFETKIVFFLKKSLPWLFISALSACAGIYDSKPEINAVGSDLRARLAESERRVVPRSGAVERVSYSKLGGRELSIEADATIPAWMNESITYVTYSQTLEGVARELSERLSIPVRMLPSLLTAQANSTSSNGLVASTPSSKTFIVEWRGGSVKELLDHISVRTDSFWKNRNGNIEFFDTDTKTFQLSIPPGTRNMSSSISAGSIGGTAGGATSSLSSTLKIDTFESAMNGIRTIVSSAPIKGAGAPTVGAAPNATTSHQVTGNAELGSVTVTARPPVLNKIESYVKAINERFAQNVLVKIRVMSVSSSKGFNAGIAINAILDTAVSRYGIKGANLLAPVSGSSPGVATFSTAQPLSNGSVVGADLVANLLSEVGEVSLLRSGQVLAVNGQPSAMQVADEVSYLAASSTTSAANVASQTSLTPGTKTIGFTASFLPMVMSDNRILLQYTLNLSSLTAMNQISSGNQMIQTPQVSTQSLQQQAYVNDGETLVLFGFEQGKNASADQMGLSLSMNRDQTRQMIVIVMDVTRTKRS